MRLMLHNNNDYLLLLSKQFSGEITPEEAETLRAWRTESAENERYARAMQSVWEQTGTYDPAVPVDVEADFSALQARIRQEKTGEFVRPAKLWRSYLRVAAAAAAAVLLGVFIWRQTATPDVALELAIAEAEKIQVNLPDGSTVWLRHGGRLQYPAQFTGSERRVRLEGEAYFEVARNTRQPFVVSTSDGGKVEVLGTKFGIQPLGDGASVLVREGKVRYTPSTGTTHAVILGGQKAVFARATDEVKIHNIYSNADICWQSGVLELKNAPMQMALEDMEKYFNANIELLDANMRDCPISALCNKNNQSLVQMLNSMKLTYNFEVQAAGPGRYILSGGNCRR
jgi:transmembrane sensor